MSRQPKLAQHGKAAKPTKGSKAGRGPEDERGFVLQAVVIAGTFDDNFMPFTIEKPRCLLPLANCPLIEYTLEFLAMNGVQEVIMYCGAHTDQVEKHIGATRWSTSSRLSPFSTLEFVKTEEATSVGDFMRNLSKRGCVSGDFILVHGDLVANISLDAALNAHRARGAGKSDAANPHIMTMVLRSAGLHEHRAKAQGSRPVFVVDPAQKRCLHYAEVDMSSRRSRKSKTKNLRDARDSERQENWDAEEDDHDHDNERLHGDDDDDDDDLPNKMLLDSSFLKHQEEVQVRTDLIDCGIDICTPAVLGLWDDSFDYELERRHFLHGVLKDFELNGKMIHYEEATAGYAARASDLRAYAAVARDVLGRWTFPLVPDSNLANRGGQTYRMKTSTPAGVVERGADISPESRVSGGSVVGAGTRIGRGSVVSGCAVGRSCVVGDRVTLRDCHLWDGVVVGDGATVGPGAILADGAAVGGGCVVPGGSLLSFGVSIGDGVHLGPHPVVLSQVDGRSNPVKSDNTAMPVAGRRSAVYSNEQLAHSASSLSTFADYDDDDDDYYDVASGASGTKSARTGGHGRDGGADGDDDYRPSSARSRLSSFASDDSNRHRKTKAQFHADAVSILLDSFRSSSSSGGGGGGKNDRSSSSSLPDDRDFESARYDFTGLRLAQDASQRDVRRALASAVVQRAVELVTVDGLTPTKAAERTVAARPAVARFIREVTFREHDGGDGGDHDDQIELELALQKAAVAAAAAAAAAAPTRGSKSGGGGGGGDGRRNSTGGGGGDGGSSKDAAAASQHLDMQRAGLILSALLQQLYNLDVLDEDHILGWWDDARAADREDMATARNQCAALVEWLREADEDEDEDEDEEDDE